MWMISLSNSRGVSCIATSLSTRRAAGYNGIKMRASRRARCPPSAIATHGEIQENAGPVHWEEPRASESRRRARSFRAPPSPAGGDRRLRHRAATLLSSCQRAEEQVAPEIRPVRALTVAKGAGGGTFTLTGTVQAQSEVNESFRIDGRLLERLVGVGDAVRRASSSRGSTRRTRKATCCPRGPS